ncbi:polycystin-1-like [Amphiura filiformis]|uniref:polycystin-1-like n=1 Tax=Amphiura filiformis TaxID=82378 RepID=UPI003B21D04D
MYSLYYTYGAAGSYIITITAENKLNLQKVSGTVYVEYPIQGLMAYIVGNSTTHTDRSSFIVIKITQGTNVEYTCNYNDGSLPIVTKKQFCKHMFIALGPFDVTVEAENHLSYAITWSNATYNVHLPPVPHVIQGLYIDVEEANTLGVPAVFMLYRYRGNRFNCTWQFGDNTTLLTDITLIYSPIIHTYEEIGFYTIWVTCDNFYHPPVTTSTQLTVQVHPDGLNLTSALVGQYNTDLMFNISIGAGTDMEAALNYTGYGFTMVVNELQGFVVVPAYYVNESGWREVVITAWNMVPPVLVLTKMIYIEAEITGLRVWADQPYVSIGTIVTFYAELNTGTNVTFEWSFGTNEVIESTVNSTGNGVYDTKQHLYTELGLYAVNVRAFNEIGILSHTPVLVAVEDSVKGFSLVTNSPVVYPDGVISFTCYWDMSYQTLPTNASIEVYFGDKDYEEPLTVCLDSLERITFFRVYYDQYTTDGCGGSTDYNPFCNSSFVESRMSGTKLDILSVDHEYTPGVYGFVLKVLNLASEKVFTETVETQVPLVNMSIATHNSQRPGIVHGQAGGGPLRNYFPIEYAVHFEVHLDLGTGSLFLWKPGDGSSVSTKETHIEYQYYRAKSFEVRLIASNVFSLADAFTTVNLEESVLGLFAAHSGSTPMNKPVTIILFAAQVGTSPTYILTIIDKFDLDRESSNHTSDHTSSNHTSEEFHPPEDTHSIVKPVFSKALVDEALHIMDPNIYLPFDPTTHAVTLHTLTFEKPGEYVIELEGYNYASYLSTITVVPIIEEPCQLPYIFIYGGSKEVSNPWQVKKNHEIMLISEVILNCSSTYTASFHWDVYHVEFFNGKPLPSNDLYRYKLPIEVDLEESDLVIPRRSVNYGTYLFQLTVTMDNYGKVSNKNQTYVEVVPSPIHVRIAGGLSVTVQENATLVLNASMSYDPDEQVTEEFHHHLNQSATELYKLHGLKFEWFCKRHQNGSFPFEHGYEQIAVVSKEGRQDVMVEQVVYVLSGEPPQLDIRCVRNCQEKINPQKHLALAVDCMNCINETTIEYEWTVRYSNGMELQKTPGYQDYIIDGALTGLCRDTDDGDHALFNAATANIVSETESTPTALSGGNLLPPAVPASHRIRYMVVQSPLFTNKSGEVLSISVKGYWSNSRSYGLSQEEYVIGDIPTMGNCTVEPMDGVALQTQFVIQCQDFYSEEKPLHYEYMYSTGQLSVASVSSQASFQQDTGAYTLLFHSPEGSSPPITLPMGLKDRNYMLDVRINVKDGIGATVQFNTHVQVFPPDSSTIAVEIAFLKAVNDSDTVSSLELFLGKGDTQGATKLLTTIATILNEEEGGNEEDTTDRSDNIDSSENSNSSDVVHAYKTEVRALLVEKLSDIPVHNLDSAKQKSAAITQAVLHPNELTPETQQTAADAYLSMLGILDEESKEGTSLDIIEDASKYFFSGVNNLCYLILASLPPGFSVLFSAFSLLEAASGQATGFYKILQNDPVEWQEFWTAKEAALNDTEMPTDVPLTLGLVSAVSLIDTFLLESKPQPAVLISVKQN